MTFVGKVGLVEGVQLHWAEIQEFGLGNQEEYVFAPKKNYFPSHS
jgi:hypothetical protein